MEPVAVIRVVAVSPGDVQNERERLQQVVDGLNRTLAPSRGCRLSLWRWETDAHPGLHLEGPQGLIDAAMAIEDADVVIGIFWTRFGTPTGDADSGTEHELRRAWAAWRERGRPQVKVYFCERESRAKRAAEAQQLARLLAFREAMPRASVPRASSAGRSRGMPHVSCSPRRSRIQRRRRRGRPAPEARPRAISFAPVASSAQCSRADLAFTYRAVGRIGERRRRSRPLGARRQAMAGTRRDAGLARDAATRAAIQRRPPVRAAKVERSARAVRMIAT
jgi:hypothetical protein